MLKVNHIRVSTAIVAVVLAVGVWALVGTKPAEAAFPGKNGKIAFVSERVTATNPEGDPDIFTMNPDGSRVRQLTHNADDDSEPAYAADGKKFAYRSSERGSWEISTISANGKKQKNRTKNPAGDYSPDWQPLVNQAPPD